VDVRRPGRGITPPSILIDKLRDLAARNSPTIRAGDRYLRRRNLHSGKKVEKVTIRSKEASISRNAKASRALMN